MMLAKTKEMRNFETNYRQVLKIAFEVFLLFSRADFAYHLKEHSELCD